MNDFKKGLFAPFLMILALWFYCFLVLGGGEIFIILLVILLLFGSKRIPEIARGMGKGIRQFKDATNDIQSDLTDSIKEVKKDIDQTKKELDK